MRRRDLWQAIPVAILLMSAGCYTQFSPAWSRQEIERQTGAAPVDALELQLAGATMKFAQATASKSSWGSGHIRGLSRIDLALYELPSGRQVDFDRMEFRGWDKFLRSQEGSFQLMILVRAGGDALADLVVFAQGESQLLYGRLEGTLDAEVPAALRNAVRTGGLERLREYLLFSSDKN